MSVYAHIKRTADQLQQTGMWLTDLGVVSKALRSEWGAKEHKKALLQANQYLSARYRAGELVRFGPVMVDGERDYVRVNGRIVYADPSVKTFKTSEREMPCMTYPDQIGHVGRRAGTNRDDRYKLPSEQDRVRQLERNLARALHRINQLEQERKVTHE
jgi:hypothetical protein